MEEPKLIRSIKTYEYGETKFSVTQEAEKDEIIEISSGEGSIQLPLQKLKLLVGFVENRT